MNIPTTSDDFPIQVIIPTAEVSALGEMVQRRGYQVTQVEHRTAVPARDSATLVVFEYRPKVC